VLGFYETAGCVNRNLVFGVGFAFLLLGVFVFAFAFAFISGFYSHSQGVLRLGAGWCPIVMKRRCYLTCGLWFRGQAQQRSRRDARLAKSVAQYFFSAGKLSIITTVQPPQRKET
jgi:predicted cobalt transporter CbtA